MREWIQLGGAVPGRERRKERRFNQMKWSRVTLPTIVTNSFTTTEARDRKACSTKMNGSRLSLGGPGGVSEGQITTEIDGFAVNHGIKWPAVACVERNELFDERSGPCWIL